MYALYFVLVIFALESSPLSSVGESSALTRAVFLIDLARIPKRRVERVSGRCKMTETVNDEGGSRVTTERFLKDTCKFRVTIGICLSGVTLQHVIYRVKNKYIPLGPSKVDDIQELRETC